MTEPPGPDPTPDGPGHPTPEAPPVPLRPQIPAWPTPEPPVVPAWSAAEPPVVPGWPAEPAGPRQAWPAAGHPAAWMGPVMLPPLPAPPGAYPVPVAYEPLSGTPYGLVYVRVRPVTSGAAVAALAAGIASIVVALVMSCLGLAGTEEGWGTLAAGAFAILSALFAGAAIWVGTVAVRAIRRTGWTPATRTYAAAGGFGAPDVTGGGGMAGAARVCGWVGLGLTCLGFAGVLLASLGSG